MVIALKSEYRGRAWQAEIRLRAALETSMAGHPYPLTSLLPPGQHITRTAAGDVAQYTLLRSVDYAHSDVDQRQSPLSSPGTLVASVTFSKRRPPIGDLPVRGSQAEKAAIRRTPLRDLKLASRCSTELDAIYQEEFDQGRWT